MRRRSQRCVDLNLCPMCHKVVEYGVMCDCCACWFHATETCCGDSVADAFLAAGKESWCCLNCFPKQGEAAPPDPLKMPAALVELLSWRQAFRILTDSCAGCNLKVTPRLDYEDGSWSTRKAPITVKSLQRVRRHAPTLHKAHRVINPHRPYQVAESSSALRCASCELCFHAASLCTGLGAAAISKQLARTPDMQDGAWRCPTCMLTLHPSFPTHLTPPQLTHTTPHNHPPTRSALTSPPCRHSCIIPPNHLASLPLLSFFKLPFPSPLLPS